MISHCCMNSIKQCSRHFEFKIGILSHSCYCGRYAAGLLIVKNDAWAAKNEWTVIEN